MVNFYLIESRENKLLVINDGSMYDLINLGEKLEKSISEIYKYISHNKITRFTTYTMNFDFLDRHANKGLNIRFGSIDDRGIK